MSAYQHGDRYLGVLIIALVVAYLALGLSFIPYLLPTSSIAILVAGSGER